VNFVYCNYLYHPIAVKQSINGNWLICNSSIIYSNVANVSGITFSSNPFSVYQGSSGTVNISGGTSPYSINFGSNPSIANATISGNSLNVQGIGAGSTYVTIQDSSTNTLYATLNISVTSSSNNINNTNSQSTAITVPSLVE
jgi:hypothetical protein